jgi:hypothetical protein
MKSHSYSSHVHLNRGLLPCRSPRIMRSVSVAVVLATMWLCPACAQAFTVFDVSGYGIGRWETDPHFVDGVERSLDGGLRYSVQGGSYEAYRDLFQWEGAAPSVPAFQVAVEQAFAAWEVVDPATGLGTDLRFVPDLGTPVVGEISPDSAADRAHLNRGAEIDLLAGDLDSFGADGVANPYLDPIDNTVTLTSGVANYPAAVISGVDIFLNNAHPWGNLASFHTVLIHEIGHAIGLGDVDVAEGAGEVLTKFYDDNFDGTNTRTAIATLTNAFAHLIDPLDPDNSPALMLYSLCVPIDPNDPRSCNSNPGLDSPGVDLLMESSGGPTQSGTPQNDAFAGRQFLYPYVVPEPSSLLLAGLAGLLFCTRRR